jgi:uncharacterized SAM-binding protein YcdF (DUF218 family)
MRALGWIASVLTVVLLVLAGGFIGFVAALPQAETLPPRPAQGIVVLTGGPDRIAEGLQLLASGFGERILITGVHGRTSREDLERSHGINPNLTACCIDLDWQALNTRGNAQEAANWARRNGYSDLILVTSSWHMPRATEEMRRAMPEARVTPHAVVPPRAEWPKWWRDASMMRLLAMEYAKYCATRLRALALRTASALHIG